MQPAVATLPSPAIPDRERRAVRSESYPALLGRLARLSVTKHFDAYADVDWDAPASRIDPEDPCFERDADDPLGATAWYRSRPQPVRARLGLHLIATQVKLGMEFERVLKQGLLAFASTLADDAPELRYAYHEVIEEAQHSLMFRELLLRMGLEVHGLSWIDRLGSRRVARTGRTFPELFFLFVLGGEEPIDHAQRTTLRSGRPIHPLLRRVMQIHVTEEARHICFAREYLRHHVPLLPPARRASLAVQAPLLLADMAHQMMRPSAHVVRTYDIPPAVVAEAFTRSARHRAFVLESVGEVRALCEELGLVTRLTGPLWRRLGVGPAPTPAA
jgi:para-aminobenzoate N-oxygenase AurF